MANYIFIVKGPDQLSETLDVELLNDKAARVEAVQFMGELLRDVRTVFRLGLNWTLSVKAPCGSELVAIQVDMANYAAPAIPERSLSSGSAATALSWS